MVYMHLLKTLARPVVDRSRLIPMGKRFRLSPGGPVYTVVNVESYSEVTVAWRDKFGFSESRLSARLVNSAYPA